jgi:hypothetical protein
MILGTTAELTDEYLAEESAHFEHVFILGEFELICRFGRVVRHDKELVAYLIFDIVFLE